MTRKERLEKKKTDRLYNYVIQRRIELELPIMTFQNREAISKELNRLRQVRFRKAHEKHNS